MAVDGRRALGFALIDDVRVFDGCDDANELVELLLVGDVPRVVLDGQARLVGVCPDLEEVDVLRRVAVVLAVTDTGAGACKLAANIFPSVTFT